MVKYFLWGNGADAYDKLFLSNGHELVSANWLLCSLKTKQLKKEKQVWNNSFLPSSIIASKYSRKQNQEYAEL